MKKLFSILLVVCLVVSLISVSKTEINAEVVNAADILREGLKNRENTITVSGTSEDVDSIINEALKHTGVSTEGDYIKFHLTSNLTGRVNGTEIKFSPRYLSTYAQEQELTTKLNEFYDSLNLEMNSYDKLKAIYDYICDNVVYGYQQNSAYAALVNGSSSCRGYALLFYRMALDLGFDVRIVSGRVVGGSYDSYHEWNIVKVGSKYYNVDVNFGDNTGDQMGAQARYTYFLKGTEGIFKDGYGSYVPAHVRDEVYDTEEFNTEYPMSSTDCDKNNIEEEPIIPDTPSEPVVPEEPIIPEEPEIPEEEITTTEKEEETTESTEIEDTESSTESEETTEETTENNTESTEEPDNNDEPSDTNQDTSNKNQLISNLLKQLKQRVVIVKVKLIKFFKCK